ncbi:MAG: hypothetical protein LQ344_003939 [Seirophora lacunosa]|nr:MAG: hypothetical protein LQ344_003939 [Seirophora lacunosa]
MTPSHQETLAALSGLQFQPLSIIRLSEPISNPTNPTTTNARTSDISVSGLTDDATNPTPISLAADLSHYRDLFSKLRFSYLEQVTKEKFLRAIVGDPPLIIENAENVELESQLGEVKNVLKEQKEHVARMVQELERKGRELAGRYEQIGLKTELLGQLPREIQGLEDKIRKLREETKGSMVGMGGGLGLDRVLEMTREKDRQKKEVERELKALQGEIPGKGRLLERLGGELKGLDREKEKAVEGAREAVKNRESGGATIISHNSSQKTPGTGQSDIPVMAYNPFSQRGSEVSMGVTTRAITHKITGRGHGIMMAIPRKDERLTAAKITVA